MQGQPHIRLTVEVFIVRSFGFMLPIIITIIKFRIPQLKTKEAVTQARHMTTFRNLFSTRFVILLAKEAIPR